MLKVFSEVENLLGTLSKDREIFVTRPRVRPFHARLRPCPHT